MNTDYLGSKDVAERLNVSQNSVSRWRKKGYGPAWIRVGGFYRYPRAEFEQWCAENMAVV